MAKPLSRILVIEDEPRSLDNPLGITFSGAATAREALAAIETDGDIQAVLVDDKLYSLPGLKKTMERKSSRCRRWNLFSASPGSGPSSTSTS